MSRIGTGGLWDSPPDPMSRTRLSRPDRYRPGASPRARTRCTGVNGRATELMKNGTTGTFVSPPKRISSGCTVPWSTSIRSDTARSMPASRAAWASPSAMPRGTSRGPGVEPKSPGVAGVGVLLHPLPLQAHQAEGAARGLAQRRHLRRHQTREEPHAEPCPQIPHKPATLTPGGHLPTRIKINKRRRRREARRRSTGGCGPGGPQFRYWSTPGTPIGPASPAAGCCARWGRRR